MVGHNQSGLAVSLLAMVLLGSWASAGVAAAQEHPQAPVAAPAAGIQPAQPVQTPEELRALELLRRYQLEYEIQRQQNAFRAENLVRLAKDKLEMGDHRGAMHDFEKASELDPDNRNAQAGFRRTRIMLNVETKRLGGVPGGYFDQTVVIRDMYRMELSNKFGDAKALFDKGLYRDAIEAFGRTQSLAQYVSPNIDVGKMVEDCGAYILQAQRKLEEKRAADAVDARNVAQKIARQLAEDRRNGLEVKTQALYRQATALFDQRRFEEARKTCEAILLKDPTNYAAQTLRESAVASSDNEEIDRALRARKVETDRLTNWTRAAEVPQTELVYLSREKFEEVRSRPAMTSFSDAKVEAAPWEAKIREAMNKKISFDFVETPLQDVVTFISSLVDVTIVLDTEAVKDEPKTITLRVNDMRLESALNWVLKLVGLKYTLKDEAVFISKPDRIIERASLRMYDVSDLTIDIKNFAGRHQALASDGGGSTTGAGGSNGGSSDANRDFWGPENEQKPEDEKLTGQSLVDFIKRTIATGSWIDDEPGAVGK